MASLLIVAGVCKGWDKHGGWKRDLKSQALFHDRCSEAPSNTIARRYPLQFTSTCPELPTLTAIALPSSVLEFLQGKLQEQCYETFPEAICSGKFAQHQFQEGLAVDKRGSPNKAPQRGDGV